MKSNVEDQEQIIKATIIKDAKVDKRLKDKAYDVRYSQIDRSIVNQFTD